MRARELLNPIPHQTRGAKVHQAKAQAGAVLYAEATDPEHAARHCARLLATLAHNQSVGRHLSKEQSTAKSVGRVKEEGPPKNSKPPAVQIPRKLKARNAI